MAEALAVLGALSSVLQIVEFAAKVGSHVHELMSSGNDQSRVNLEAERLAQACTQLHQETKDLTVDSNATPEERIVIDLGTRCRTEATMLLDVTSLLTITTGAKGFRRFRQAVKFATDDKRRKEVERRRKNLQELNGLLSTAYLQAVWAKEKEQIMHILSIEKVVLLAEEDKIINRVLRSLSYGEMMSRPNAINQAYPDTYRWALEDESSSFRRWLVSGENIYWITGKGKLISLIYENANPILHMVAHCDDMVAGSGKSTLMKFLTTQEHTRKLLQEWCPNRKLEIGSFFFWYLGTPLQKSVNGLLRSILFQILSRTRQHLKEIYPEFFGEQRHVQIEIDWTLEDLYAGIRRLTTWISQTSALKLCLFIDGLDEYHGHHPDLVELIQEIAGMSGVKICVSSRPWNAFRVAYEDRVPNLRLEDLSYSDVRLYVSGRLTAITTTANDLKPSSTKLAVLIDEIVGRAEGVFLWVFLVVTSVLQGFAEGDSISMLQQRVQQFPADLEDFFRNILGRVDSVYKHQTNQALKLAHSLVREDSSNYQLSSFIDYWLIKQETYGLGHTNFAYTRRVQKIEGGDTESMIQETRAFLSATCRDLLIVPHVNRLDWPPRVEFLHRTVYDFLSSEPMQILLDASTPSHFHSRRIFHLLNLARLKFDLQYGADPERIRKTICDAAEMSLASDHVDLCDEYVDNFDEVLFYHSELFISSPVQIEWAVNHISPAVFATLVSFRKLKFIRFFLSTAETFSAYLYKHLDKTYWILVAALGEYSYNRFGLNEVDIGFLQDFLELGVDPNNRVLSENRADQDDPSTAKYSFEPCVENLWQMFLRKWAVYVRERTRGSPSPNRGAAHFRRNYLRHIWEIAKTFLAKNAVLDCFFCVEPSLPGHDDHVHRWVMANEFMRDQVPQEWLKELPTRILKDIATTASLSVGDTQRFSNTS